MPNAGQWFPSDIRLSDIRFPEMLIAHLRHLGANEERQHPTYSPILTLAKEDGNFIEKWVMITQTKCVKEKG